jgi:hypothetical protein
LFVTGFLLQRFVEVPNFFGYILFVELFSHVSCIIYDAL